MQNTVELLEQAQNTVEREQVLNIAELLELELERNIVEQGLGPELNTGALPGPAARVGQRERYTGIHQLKCKTSYL